MRAQADLMPAVRQIEVLEVEKQQETVAKAVLLQCSETHGHELVAAKATIKELQASIVSLKCDHEDAGDALQNHPAVLQLQEERSAHAATEAALHAALRALLPYEQHALGSHRWREQVLGAAQQAAEPAVSQEAQVQELAKGVRASKDAYEQVSQVPDKCKEDAAEFQLQVMLRLGLSLALVASV